MPVAKAGAPLKAFLDNKPIPSDKYRSSSPKSNPKHHSEKSFSLQSSSSSSTSENQKEFIFDDDDSDCDSSQILDIKDFKKMLEEIDKGDQFHGKVKQSPHLKELNKILALN